MCCIPREITYNRLVFQLFHLNATLSSSGPMQTDVGQYLGGAPKPHLTQIMNITVLGHPKLDPQSKLARFGIIFGTLLNFN